MTEIKEIEEYYEGIDVHHVTITQVMELLADVTLMDKREIIDISKIIKGNFTYIHIHTNCSCNSEECIGEAKTVLMFANQKSMRHLGQN